MIVLDNAGWSVPVEMIIFRFLIVLSFTGYLLVFSGFEAKSWNQIKGQVQKQSSLSKRTLFSILNITKVHSIIYSSKC